MKTLIEGKKTLIEDKQTLIEKAEHQPSKLIMSIKESFDTGWADWRYIYNRERMNEI